jgi:hypothetical protein
MTLGDGGVVWTSLASRELGGATLNLNSAEASRSSWRESEVPFRVGLSKISIEKPATLFRPVECPREELGLAGRVKYCGSGVCCRGAEVGPASEMYGEKDWVFSRNPDPLVLVGSKCIQSFVLAVSCCILLAT